MIVFLVTVPWHLLTISRSFSSICASVASVRSNARQNIFQEAQNSPAISRRSSLDGVPVLIEIDEGKAT